VTGQPQAARPRNACQNRTRVRPTRRPVCSPPLLLHRRPQPRRERGLQLLRSPRIQDVLSGAAITRNGGGGSLGDAPRRQARPRRASDSVQVRAGTCGPAAAGAEAAAHLGPLAGALDGGREEDGLVLLQVWGVEQLQARPPAPGRCAQLRQPAVCRRAVRAGGGAGAREGRGRVGRSLKAARMCSTAGHVAAV
jgi:hypothetical protein